MISGLFVSLPRESCSLAQAPTGLELKTTPLRPELAAAHCAKAPP